MKYDTLLFDADGTLLDFERSEREAISDTLREVGIEPTEETVRTYSEINDRLWKLLEQGRITKPELMVRRFELLLEHCGVTFDPKKMGEIYVGKLATKGYCIRGAQELCAYLAPRARLYIVTNGTEWIQMSRWAVSGLDRLFRELFISDRIGYPKPDVRYFEAVAKAIPDFRRESTLIIGDSLSSDMQGGVNFGIDTCWFNPHGASVSESLKGRLTYEVRSFEELLAVLEEGGDQ